MNWFAIVFGVVGIIGTIAGAVLLANGIASRRWPSTGGHVIRATAEYQTQDGGDTTICVPRVDYRYAVSGQEYVGNQISVRRFRTRRVDVEAVLSKYPVGSRVVVYYDPAKPSAALLEPGADIQAGLPLAVGIVFMIVAAIIAWGGHTK